MPGQHRNLAQPAGHSAREQGFTVGAGARASSALAVRCDVHPALGRYLSRLIAATTPRPGAPAPSAPNWCPPMATRARPRRGRAGCDRNRRALDREHGRRFPRAARLTFQPGRVRGGCVLRHGTRGEPGRLRAVRARRLPRWRKKSIVADTFTCTVPTSASKPHSTCAAAVSCIAGACGRGLGAGSGHPRRADCTPATPDGDPQRPSPSTYSRRIW